MCRFLCVLILSLTCTVFARTPRFSTSDIIYWDLATKTYADSVGGGSSTGKVDEVDGVATNLTVPTLTYTATHVGEGTNYTAVVYWDATNKVLRVTETAE